MADNGASSGRLARVRLPRRPPVWSSASIGGSPAASQGGRLRYTPLVASLPSTVPFVGPETQERQRGRPFQARLGANENGFGPSPHAVAAIAAVAGESWCYGDPENHDLKQQLAAHHGVEPSNICVGEGIDGLLGYLVRLFVAEGTRVVTSAGAYPTFNYHVAGFGGQLELVPFNSDGEDPEAVLQRANEIDASLLYFSNPNNPMGSWHPADAIQRLIAGVRPGALLCLDEAYVEFAPPGTAPALDVSDERVVRMRTFSKAYGLAGARVGYCIGHHELISSFDKIRNHFGLSRISQAGALAALRDQDWLARTVANVAAARDRITEIALAHGLHALPSATNFVTVDCGRDGEFARAVLSHLIEKGDIFIRMPGIAPCDRCIRVGCAPEPELDAFERALPRALEAAAAATADRAETATEARARL